MPRTVDPDTEVSVCPFRIIVDTREQAPWHFLEMPGYQVVPIITSRCLQTGDYSIENLEERIAIERKSVSDFYGSIGSGRERFEREMERLAKFEFAAVVIEGDWQQLLIDRPQSIRMSPAAASGTIAAWSIRYGVHFFPCMSRRHAELWAFRLLHQFWRQQQ